MPYMQLATVTMNSAFGERGGEGLAPDDRELFDPRSALKLPEALRRSSIDVPEAVLEFLDQWPSALLAAVQAIISENFNREVTVPITFAWQPAYDYSITVHDVSDTPETKGGITIVLTSRYPRDEHPLSKTTAS